MGNSSSRLHGTFDSIGNFKRFVYANLINLPSNLPSNLPCPIELDLEETNPGYQS